MLPDLHDNHVAALRHVYPHEAGRLVILLLQAGVLRFLPPTIGTLEGFKLNPAFAPVPIGAYLPAVPGAVHERTLE